MHLPMWDDMRIERYASQRCLLILRFQIGTRRPPLCNRGSWPWRSVFSSNGKECRAKAVGQELQTSAGMLSGPVAFPVVTCRKADSSAATGGKSSIVTTTGSECRLARFWIHLSRCGWAERRIPPSMLPKNSIHLFSASSGVRQGWSSRSRTWGSGAMPLFLRLLVPTKGLRVCKIVEADAVGANLSMCSATPLNLAAFKASLSCLAWQRKSARHRRLPQSKVVM